MIFQPPGSLTYEEKKQSLEFCKSIAVREIGMDRVRYPKDLDDGGVAGGQGASVVDEVQNET
jgi:hypothetical protein